MPADPITNQKQIRHQAGLNEYLNEQSWKLLVVSYAHLFSLLGRTLGFKKLIPNRNKTCFTGERSTLKRYKNKTQHERK